MQLSTGDKLGPYEILSLLGKGGMGEVYKARDSRLHRDVAIKVSSAEFSTRFEREARAVAALNHSNICTLYDVGPNYLVMEHIEGSPLQGPLPMDQALKYAMQICDALSAAHKKGITHRDLKPANILVTKAGVKLLDFGLAKFAHDEMMDSDTLSMELTGRNQIVGTLCYMSPEQLQRQGGEIDGRSDIFSFGLVLYEMLTGKRAIAAASQAGVIAAILEGPAPSISEIAPPALERVLQICLAKDRDERWQTARDLRRQLEWVSNEAIGEPQAALPGHRVLPWVVTGVFAVALLFAGALLFNATRPTPLRPLIRFNAEIAPDLPMARANNSSGGGGNMLAISPDGARLALTLRAADGKVRIHIRQMNLSQVSPLLGTENAFYPFFSPDGQWIGFFADGKLKKIAVEGGAAVTLCNAPLGMGGSWGDDGNIIAALNNNEGLSRVPSTGGPPVVLTKLKAGEATHRWPQALPGGDVVVFTASANASGGFEDANIDVISLKTGKQKTIHHGGFFARYVADEAGSSRAGYLIYMQQSTLFGVPFDLGRLALTGAPVPMLLNVSSSPTSGGDFVFAVNGTFAFVSGKESRTLWSISSVNSSGKIETLNATPGQYFSPRFSPDGKRLVYGMGNGKGTDIWVKDLERDNPSRLSFLPGINSHPVWTPDGKSILFNSSNSTSPGLYAIRSDGSGEAKRLTDGNPSEFLNSISPDGKRLAINKTGNGGSLDIFTMPVETDPGPGGPGIRLGKAELFLGTTLDERSPAFSPDGHWLAYVSSESGNFDVHVRPFPGPGGRWQISTDGGRFPVWSRDGRELLFETLDQRVMAVSYSVKGESFSAQKPRLWTETRLQAVGLVYNYDLAPDGKRLAAFVDSVAAGEKMPTHLTFLLNFLDELRRKAPGK